MVPEERSSSQRVVASFVDQVRAILVHSVVHRDGLVLEIRAWSATVVESGGQRRDPTYPHGTIVAFVVWIVVVEAESTHELVLGYARSNGPRHLGNER